MNEQRLQEIKKRADRATTGPWFCSWSTFEEFAKVNIEGFCITDELNDFDAEFIAHARQDVPALIAEVERLRSVIWRISDRYDISINETKEFLAGEQNAI